MNTTTTTDATDSPADVATTADGLVLLEGQALDAARSRFGPASRMRFAENEHAPLTPAALRAPHSRRAWIALPFAEREVHLLTVFAAQRAEGDRLDAERRETEASARTAARAAQRERAAAREAVVDLSASPEAEVYAPRPGVAVVACACMCGRWLPSPSTYRPSVRWHHRDGLAGDADAL